MTANPNRTDIAGQHALVTGASRGIGAACALALAQAGAQLTLAARSMTDLEAIAEQCRAEGVAVRIVATDLRDTRSIEALATQAGAVDVLINNAGVLHLAPVQDMTLAQWDELFDVNLRSVFYLTHLLVPHMIAQRRGQIVNINSGAGYGIGGYRGGGGYAATKFALRAFSNSIRHDLHPYSIRVMQVYPGYVDTAIFGDTPPAGIEKHLKPADIADAVLYALCTPPHVDVPEMLVTSYEQDW
jgi:NADP-dependent 3-hydroxy acid dehydrogenase YdfG